MNKSIFIGRLVKDPEISSTTGAQPISVARYTLAVDRPAKGGNDQSADFIPVTAYGKAAEFTERYFKKGQRVAIAARFRSYTYTNRDGVKVYSYEFIVDDQEFADGKRDDNRNQTQPAADSDGFMTTPEGYDEGLPFN